MVMSVWTVRQSILSLVSVGVRQEHSGMATQGHVSPVQLTQTLQQAQCIVLVKEDTISVLDLRHVSSVHQIQLAERGAAL